MLTRRSLSAFGLKAILTSLVGACSMLQACGGNTAAPTPAPTPAQATETAAPATPPAAPATDVPATDVSAPATDATQEAEDLPPPITIDPPVLDFGVISPSDIAEGVVKLRNTGTKELEVLSVQPSCKCTTINDVAGQKIPVGGFVEIQAKMKPTSGAGDKKAEIKVLIDGYSRIVSIQLKSEVSMPVRVKPYYLNIVTGQPQMGRTVVESIDGRPFKICAIGGYAPHYIGFDPTKDEPANHYVIDWNIERDFPGGKFPRYWIIETDHPDCPLVEIFVRHETTMPKINMALSDYRHTFGQLEAGKSAEFVVTCTKLEEDEAILAASASSTDLKVELVSQVRDGTDTIVTLRATSTSSARGLTYVNATIYSAKRQQDFELWGQVIDPGFTGCFPCKERAEITPSVDQAKPIRGIPTIAPPTRPTTNAPATTNPTGATPNPTGATPNPTGATPNLSPNAPVGVK